jgi:hypothetical protein
VSGPAIGDQASRQDFTHRSDRMLKEKSDACSHPSGQDKGRHGRRAGPQGQEGSYPIISDVPGFRAYYVIYAPDDTVTTISIFNDYAGAQESNKRGLAWKLPAARLRKAQVDLVHRARRPGAGPAAEGRPAAPDRGRAPRTYSRVAHERRCATEGSCPDRRGPQTGSSAEAARPAAADRACSSGPRE